jgi:asparagine synthetase B (glutamine-hydrolysing)
MKLKFFINASHWHCVDDHEFRTYSSLTSLPQRWPAHKAYYPFAWIRIHKQTQEILAARDHIGQEPFYYAIIDDTLIFGSTLPDLLAHFKHSPALSKHLLEDCFLRQVRQDLPLATETYYQGIYRVRPAHYLIIKPCEKPHQLLFWSLYDQEKTLYYSDERDYVAHLSELLNEAVMQTTRNSRSLAAELSGGIDSSMIFNACKHTHLTPTLYTQEIPTHYPVTDETCNIQLILTQYIGNMHHLYVNADNFNPLLTFEKMAYLFASSAPYLISVLADNLYTAVAQAGHDVLLSGAAGDELVSHHFPPQLAFPQLWQEKKWQGLWEECKQLPTLKQKIKYATQRLGYSRTDIYAIYVKIERFYHRFSKKRTRLFQPDFYAKFNAYEYGNLQGDLAHDVLMRVEYESIIAKSKGFRFAYPLLYVPLLEFCFRLPLDQKLRLNTTRWLARQYLSQQIPEFRFKTKGGSFVPNTMQKCRDYAKSGLFKEAFQALPFSELIEKETHPEKKLLLQINAYMLKCAETQVINRVDSRRDQCDYVHFKKEV